MRKDEIEVGRQYDWGGYLVDVLEVTPDGIVIECPEVGQEIVKPASLKESYPETTEPTFYDS